jgi:hypothetical protein
MDSHRREERRTTRGKAAARALHLQSFQNGEAHRVKKIFLLRLEREASNYTTFRLSGPAKRPALSAIRFRPSVRAYVKFVPVAGSTGTVSRALHEALIRWIKKAALHFLRARFPVSCFECSNNQLNTQAKSKALHLLYQGLETLTDYRIRNSLGDRFDQVQWRRNETMAKPA